MFNVTCIIQWNYCSKHSNADDIQHAPNTVTPETTGQKSGWRDDDRTEVGMAISTKLGDNGYEVLDTWSHKSCKYFGNMSCNAMHTRKLQPYTKVHCAYVKGIHQI